MYRPHLSVEAVQPICKKSMRHTNSDDVCLGNCDPDLRMSSERNCQATSGNYNKFQFRETGQLVPGSQKPVQTASSGSLKIVKGF
jgi:hypothetical protein